MNRLPILSVLAALTIAAGTAAHAAQRPDGAGPRLPTANPVAAPYPRSPVIQEIVWAPKSEIIRHAEGSDNWPMTWADDDALYTAYGDGWGFAPLLPTKLSIGFAKVLGRPPAIQGVNIRTPSGEAIGQGAAARKASGILMVNGVLYLLVRNVGNAQLAWSRDHGASWTWADWKFTTSFGCPTFLNYGRNCAGARDEFVYIYSLDGASAYQPSDRMVLARVPQGRITERAAYEFFRGIDAAAKPQWAPNIEQREAVFAFPGNCYRGGITYHAALKRYLWCQILPGSTHAQGPRFQGGFGIYDAPEPWGPWTAAYYTPAWDVGPGDMSVLPTKWMSADGKTMHLVFAGDDHFSVRQAKIVIAENR